MIEGIVDSHCHLDDSAFDADRPAVVARARAAGVTTLLVVGGLDSAGAQERALGVGREFGFPVAAGLHPHEARHHSPVLHAALGRLAAERRIVAIGEIGLDYHYDHSPRDAQRGAFRRQLRLARETGLPVIVHSRAADEDSAAILEDEGAGAVAGVMHCFASGADLAERALRLGLYLSFSGIVTFPRADALREVVRQTPEDRLLVETDAPYLAPAPHRGKRNEPAFVVTVAEAVAGLRGVSPAVLARALAANFARLFGWEQSS